MKKNLKLLALGLVMILALSSLVACGMEEPEAPEVPEDGEEVEETGSDDAEITFVYAEVNSPETIVGQMGLKFKEKVEELSEGKIKIDIQANGVLGSENDVLDSMLGGGGTIDMARISAYQLTTYGGAKSKLLSIPFTFVDRDHFWSFASSDLAKEFLLEPHDNGSGVRGLFYGEEGFRHFFTVDPVEEIADLKGLKLRVSNDPIMTGMVEGLGASPTVIAFTELYSALQTGVVDGAEQPITNYQSNAFPEVAPNMILNGHTLGAVQVIITDDAWDKLTEEQQDIFMQAAAYTEKFNKEISEENENRVLEELKADGVNIVDVDDITPWQDATKDIIEESTKGNEELYQQILDFAN